MIKHTISVYIVEQVFDEIRECFEAGRRITREDAMRWNVYGVPNEFIQRCWKELEDAASKAIPGAPLPFMVRDDKP